MGQIQYISDENNNITGVIVPIELWREIEFIVARNVARGFIPAKYSEAMVSLQSGDCHPTRKRGTRLGQ